MTGILYCLMTGDYPGLSATGLEEDNLIIETVLWMHGLFF